MTHREGGPSTPCEKCDVSAELAADARVEVAEKELRIRELERIVQRRDGQLARLVTLRKRLQNDIRELEVKLSKATGSVNKAVLELMLENWDLKRSLKARP